MIGGLHFTPEELRSTIKEVKVKTSRSVEEVPNLTYPYRHFYENQICLSVLIFSFHKWAAQHERRT